MPGAPYGSAGTHDVAVERIEEGQPAVGTDIVVYLATDSSSSITTTAAQLGGALANQPVTGSNPGHAAFWTSTLVTVAQAGNGTGTVSALSKTNLSGGTSSVKASLNVGSSNSGIVLTAQLVGTAGNNISITIINPGSASAPLRLRVTGNGSSGNSQIRNSFDANLAAGGERAGQVAQVDTSAYGITPWAALERAKPTAWGFGEEAQTFSLVHTASNAASVGTVSFSGAGASPTYAILSGNVSISTPPGTPFAINSGTGAITRTTSGAAILAGETYSLTVEVFDAVGYEDTKVVTINVT